MKGRTVNLAGLIDHTLLKADATSDEINRLCEEAAKHRFATVCVPPMYVAQAAQYLNSTQRQEANIQAGKVAVATVIGFPLGSSTPFVKVTEARDAIAAGADELDMVMCIAALKDRRKSYVVQDIKSVVHAAEGRPVKVIIETGLLSEEEKRRACHLAIEAGASYVKTSTGFGPGGATIEDVRLMRQAVGPDIGVKASGGIRDYETAVAMVQAGATRIGTSSGIAIVTGEMA